MARQVLLFVLTLCCWFGTSCIALATPVDETLSDLDRMASPAGQRERSLGQTIVENIEKNPAEISKRLLSRLNDKNLSEKQLAVYVWALGLAKDKAAAGPIIDLHGQSKSELVKANCLRALAAIGGKPAEKLLLSTLDSTADREMRFNLLNLLAQMQCEAALPKMEEVLKQDPKQFYWQCIFVFGKMGDKAVPLLLKKMNDPDRNVRENAVCVLGMWLAAPEAAKPLFDRFWVEKDADLRSMILSCLEYTISNPAQTKDLFGQVVAKEKDARLLQFARETLGSLDETKSKIASAAAKKHVSPPAFQREYDKLFKSSGRKGDYEVLFSSSTADDEPKLKTLRQRILQRDSDEAFYDYRKVNGIIIRNRLIKASGSEPSR
jgi:HEAT repeat protein